jgi:hypothetical protein
MPTARLFYKKRHWARPLRIDYGFMNKKINEGDKSYVGGYKWTESK